MRTLGGQLRELRKAAGLTQDELATALNVNRATLANWEVNRAIPDPETLRRVADYFKTSVDYLLGRTDDPMPPAARKAPEEPVNPLQKRLIELGVYLRTNKELTEEDIKEIEDFIEYRRQKRMQLKRSKGDNPK